MNAWEAFFHQPESCAGLALYRIVFGLLLVLNNLLIWRDAQFFYGPGGAWPSRIRKSFSRGLNPLAYLPEGRGSVRIVQWLNLLASLCLAAGLCTPVSAALVFLSLRWWFWRNPCATYGFDKVAGLMSFLMIFSPAGNALSLDRLLAPKLGLSLPLESDPWAFRLMQVQVAMIYLSTFYSKIRGKAWRDGTASFYASHSLMRKRLGTPAFLDRPWFHRLMTWGTLAVELLFPILVWVDATRYPALLAIVALHLGLELVINIQLFGWIMIADMLLFVPARDVERLIDFVGLGLAR